MASEQRNWQATNGKLNEPCQLAKQTADLAPLVPFSECLDRICACGRAAKQLQTGRPLSARVSPGKLVVNWRDADDEYHCEQREDHNGG